MFDRSKSLILWLLAVPTVLFFYLSLFIIIRLWYPAGLNLDQLQLHVVHFSVVYALWTVVLFMFNIFETRYLQRTGPLAINLASAMTANLLVAVAYFYFQPSLIITPRRFLLSHVVLTFCLLLIWYLFIQRVFRRHFIEDLYLFAPKQEDQETLAELLHRPSLGFRIKGTVTTAEPKNLSLVEAAGIVIPDSSQLSAEQLKFLYALRQKAGRFYSYRQVYEILHRKVYLSSLTELWFLENINYQKKRGYSLAKRLTDIAVGFVGLVATAVLYPLMVLAIKADSRGPALFHQPRTGKNGSVFLVHKLRTMTAGAGNPANTWTEEKDARITRVGKFLRRLRLDELPQSWNLLVGDMSLVGPRPEQPHIVEHLSWEIPFYGERHLVKPGLTGWGQLNVYARNVEQSRAKLQYDLYYIKHRSLLFDLEIILKTLYHVITTSGV